MSKKIAVIGGGIFGTTTALHLDEAGFEVELFEKNDDILQSASGINQFRLHRGYHYPRSLDTAFSSKKAEESFLSLYRDAVIPTYNNYYAIAKEDTKTDAKQYKKFCDTCGLFYEEADVDIVDDDRIEKTFLVEESLINPMKLKEIITQRLNDSDVTLRLGERFSSEQVPEYDHVVNCTYANTNHLFSDDSEDSHHYQYELCEKVLLKLPDKFKGVSLVILDGPFMCIDPYGDTDMHLMGNVVHAIHRTNTGYYPEIPSEYEDLIDNGLIKNPPISNIGEFIKSAEEFMPDIKDAEHVGSFFTVRTVLPYVDHTDERPTIVSKTESGVINVFSGKIGNSVLAAEKVLEIIASND